MYSADLTSIDLDTFEETILTVELLPSRRLLVEGISDVVPKLEKTGITHLEDLRLLLRDKKRYPELATSLGVDEKYLTVLNREVNSYVSKPVPLSQLDVFEEQELDQLREARIRSTKDLYERCSSASARPKILAEHDVDAERLDHALKISNLVRINGVGPAFAHFLYGLGVRGPGDFNSTDPQAILERYRNALDETAAPGPELRLEDLEYCRRFSRHLDNDIEW
jgi:predicted flap endonuclease-1-like 5' DNA nuclease